MGQRICLNMIVKNEAHVIERCLRSVRPFIHSWAIADTGSSDGTQGLILKSLGDLPGELIERPWVDFAHNRNEALQIAHRHGDYVLLMDADDTLEQDAQFVLPQLDAPAYSIEFAYGTTRYFRNFLVRLDEAVRWHGVLHEVIDAPGGIVAIPLRGLRMRISKGEGARSKVPSVEKYSADAEVLRRALQDEPGNTRYAFYLAQSLRDAGRLLEARLAYQRRIEMGGWDEEIHYSKLQVAALLEREGASDAEVMLGLVCTALAYALYFWLLRDAGSERAVTVTLLVPVFAQLWGLVFLHEAIGPATIVGLGLVLLAMALVFERLRFPGFTPALPAAVPVRACAERE